MKKITIEIDDKYNNILTFTVVGCTPYEVNASTFAMNIRQHNKAVVNCDGKVEAFCE